MVTVRFIWQSPVSSVIIWMLGAGCIKENRLKGACCMVSPDIAAIVRKHWRAEGIGN